MENKSIILKLYEDNIDEIYSKSIENLETMKNISEKTEKLTNGLNKEQQIIFNEITNLENEKNEIIFKNIFVEAFSMATNIILESLNKK